MRIRTPVVNSTRYVCHVCQNFMCTNNQNKILQVTFQTLKRTLMCKQVRSHLIFFVQTNSRLHPIYLAKTKTYYGSVAHHNDFNTPSQLKKKQIMTLKIELNYIAEIFWGVVFFGQCGKTSMKNIAKTYVTLCTNTWICTFNLASTDLVYRPAHRGQCNLHCGTEMFVETYGREAMHPTLSQHLYR